MYTSGRKAEWEVSFFYSFPFYFAFILTFLVFYIPETENKERRITRQKDPKRVSESVGRTRYEEQVSEGVDRKEGR